MLFCFLIFINFYTLYINVHIFKFNNFVNSIIIQMKFKLNISFELLFEFFDLLELNINLVCNIEFITFYTSCFQWLMSLLQYLRSYSIVKFCIFIVWAINYFNKNYI